METVADMLYDLPKNHGIVFDVSPACKPSVQTLDQTLKNFH